METKDVIAAGRKRLGLTHQAFGGRVGVSRGAVQQWEKGTTAPTRKNQPAVAHLLGIKVSQLMCTSGLDDVATPDRADEKVEETRSLYAAAPPAAESTKDQITMEQVLQAIDDALAPLDALDRRAALSLLTIGMELPGRASSVALTFSAAIKSMSSKRRSA